MRWSTIAAVSLALGASTAMAADWLPPGDLRLRSDLKLLVDAGEIDLPLAAWPIPVADVQRALETRGSHEGDDVGALGAALARVTLAVDQARRVGSIEARITGGRAPLLKTFEQTPREKGEAQAAWSWEGGGFSGVLSAVAVAEPADDQTARPDGSYLAYNFDRWQIRAGWIDRYWGSGADGSLILGMNARPIPTIGIERTVSTAPQSRWLRWFGPWRAGVFVGRMESQRDDFDNPVFFGMHLVVRPRENIDVGLFRTAQLCGDGRRCDAPTFWKMFIGHDNVGINTTQADQPGNQMGGIDLRWSRPFGVRPLALYVHVVGEDGKNGVPVKDLRIFGAETTYDEGDAGYTRVHAEYTDSSCTSSTPTKVFNCAYRNSVFRYRYRGRIIGDSLDNDAAMWALGVDHFDASGTMASTSIRFADVNRGGAPDPTHAISPVPLRLWEAEGRLRRHFAFGDVEAALLVDYTTDVVTRRNETAVRGFLSWSRTFQ